MKIYNIPHGMCAMAFIIQFLKIILSKLIFLGYELKTINSNKLKIIVFSVFFI